MRLPPVACRPFRVQSSAKQANICLPAARERVQSGALLDEGITHSPPDDCKALLSHITIPSQLRHFFSGSAPSRRKRRALHWAVLRAWRLHQCAETEGVQDGCWREVWEVIIRWRIHYGRNHAILLSRRRHMSVSCSKNKAVSLHNDMWLRKCERSKCQCAKPERLCECA